MTGEDQERFEDYLKLEHYIEELRAGHIAHPPACLTPDQARIYQMVALFRSAAPAATEPRPEFAAALHTRLLAQNNEYLENADTLKLPGLQGADTLAVPNAETHTTSEKLPEVSPTPTPSKQLKPRCITFFSRRALLTGGAIAAASVVAGTTAAAVDLAVEPDTLPDYPTRLALDSNVATTWLSVTTVADLGKNAVSFGNDKLKGYVIYDDDNDQIIAMSAACTHMGCIVQWQEKERQFHCPCHNGVFSEYGKPVPTAGRVRYLASLPRLETKVENGKISVKVPS